MHVFPGGIGRIDGVFWIPMGLVTYLKIKIGSSMA